MRGHRTPVRLTALALCLALAAVACGGGDVAEVAEEPTAEVTAEVTAEATATPTADDSKAEPGVELPEDTETPTPTPEPTPTPVATVEPTPVATAEPTDDALGATSDDMGVGGEASYGSYVVVTDDTGAIQVEIPEEWAEVDGRPYEDDQGTAFFDVRASSDLEGFATTWDVPGIIVNASTEAAQSQNEVALLDERLALFSEACTYLGRQPYDDGLYTGQADAFENCGGTDAGYLILGAVPNTRAFLIRVEVQVVADRDIEALQRALDTFLIVGDV